eukprot:4895534-Pleurochrysis_carterae.AAC.2
MAGGAMGTFAWPREAQRAGPLALAAALPPASSVVAAWWHAPAPAPAPAPTPAHAPAAAPVSAPAPAPAPVPWPMYTPAWRAPTPTVRRPPAFKPTPEHSSASARTRPTASARVSARPIDWLRGCGADSASRCTTRSTSSTTTSPAVHTRFARDSRTRFHARDSRTADARFTRHASINSALENSAPPRRKGAAMQVAVSSRLVVHPCLLRESGPEVST